MNIFITYFGLSLFIAFVVLKLFLNTAQIVETNKQNKRKTDETSIQLLEKVVFFLLVCLVLFIIISDWFLD